MGTEIYLTRMTRDRPFLSVPELPINFNQCMQAIGTVAFLVFGGVAAFDPALDETTKKLAFGFMTTVAGYWLGKTGS